MNSLRISERVNVILVILVLKSILINLDVISVLLEAFLQTEEDVKFVLLEPLPLVQDQDSVMIVDVEWKQI